MNVTLPRDDVEGLETRWDECVLFVKKRSSTIESCSYLQNEDTTRARAATLERPFRTQRTGNVPDSTELRSCETATYESALSVDVRTVPENARNSSMHLARACCGLFDCGTASARGTTSCACRLLSQARSCRRQACDSHVACAVDRSATLRVTCTVSSSPKAQHFGRAA